MASVALVNAFRLRNARVACKEGLDCRLWGIDWPDLKHGHHAITFAIGCKVIPSEERMAFGLPAITNNSTFPSHAMCPPDGCRAVLRWPNAGCLLVKHSFVPLAPRQTDGSRRPARLRQQNRISEPLTGSCPGKGRQNHGWQNGPWGPPFPVILPLVVLPDPATG